MGMLIVERRVGEIVRLHGPHGTVIEIVLQETRGRRKAGIGVRAPRSWRIVRGEIDRSDAAPPPAAA